MSLECPHCGKSIMVIKTKEIDSAKSVGREGEDLSGGIVKSTLEAITEKVSKTIEKQTSALGSLENFNKMASGNLCDGRDGSLSSGWGGAMVQSLKKREDLVKDGYDPKQVAKDIRDNPDTVDRAKVAKLFQERMNGFLLKGSK